MWTGPVISRAGEALQQSPGRSRQSPGGLLMCAMLMPLLLFGLIRSGDSAIHAAPQVERYADSGNDAWPPARDEADAAVPVPANQWREACYQVLGDPSVVNRYAFETFHQYLAYCVEKKLRGEPLPWQRNVLARSDSTGPVFTRRQTGRSAVTHA